MYLLLIFVFAAIYHFYPVSMGISRSFAESIYFSISTITTLGYGDITPTTDAGKIVASVEALLGIALLGLFLNALSHKRTDDINIAAEKREQRRKEELRKSLELHACLPIEALMTGNPFGWDKHAKHSATMSDLNSFTHTTLEKLPDSKFQLSTLQIKALLESCHQNYETLAALAPLAADVSHLHLLEWSSLLSNARNLRDQYTNTLGKTVQEEARQWPSKDNIALQVQEYIQATLFISKPL